MKECFQCGGKVIEQASFCPHCGAKQGGPLTDGELHRDPYIVLQVSRDAETEVIDAAYRSLARKYHPDVSLDAASQERMRAINWAHEILTDNEKRRDWDRRSSKTRTHRSRTSSTAKDRPPDQT